MKWIDPTYLRSINDGLNAGSLNKDNATALPIGLVGVFEEALPPGSNVNDRKKFMEFFGVWALLKKEVSVAFVLPLLEGWTEEEVVNFIDRYSKWFNSPVPGKLILYHEGFRAFLLQKISHGQFIEINALIIKYAQDAIEAKHGEDWEFYALEHLSSHLLITAMKNGYGNDLKALAYNTTHWNRQVELSKGFEWSKGLLDDMMFWASKYNDDEVIECALNKVDLYHLEQNDAPRIIELVAQNDIETALNRIEGFGGNDKEGLQRKFILYMLCLIELTLLESKDKPFRKEAVEKLLKHLDDNLPVDHSILNWNDFFPSYLMFQMACDWADLGLDYLRVYKRTEYWDSDWIQEKGPYIDQYFEILLNCAKNDSEITSISLELVKQGKFDDALTSAEYIRDGRSKGGVLSAISLGLAKQGRFDQAFAHTRGINREEIKSIAVSAISSELATQGRFDEAASAMQESIAYAKDISDEWVMGDALSAISGELTKQGLVEEALLCAKGIKGERGKSVAFKSISNELAKQGSIDESLTFAQNISNEWIMYDAITTISRELVKKGRVKEARECTQNIADEFEQNKAHSTISLELAKQGRIEESFEFVNNISNEWTDKYKTLSAISNEFSKQGLVEEATFAMQASLEYARGISDEREKSKAYRHICNELAKQERFEEAVSLIQESFEHAESISFASEMASVENHKAEAMSVISLEMVKQGRLKEAIECAQGMNRTLGAISLELAKQGRFDDALANAQRVNGESGKSEAFEAICLELVKQGKVKEAIAYVQDISNESEKNEALNAISRELAKQGLLEEAQVCAKGIKGERGKNETFKTISTELAKQGRIKESLSYAESISNKMIKNDALIGISLELAKQGRFDDALANAQRLSGEYGESQAISFISSELAKQGWLDEAWTYAQGATDEWVKNEALRDISLELAKQGRFDDAFANAQSVSDEWAKNNAIGNIALELVKLGRLEESMKCALGIFDESDMNIVLGKISKELAKQGYWTVAEEVGMEITQSSARFRCWKDLATKAFNENGWLSALSLVANLQNAEFKISYLKVMAELINASVCNKLLVLNSRNFFLNDLESLEKILQQHALHELFFTDAKPEKIQRYNRTLNIQWAIDVKNTLIENK